MKRKFYLLLGLLFLLGIRVNGQYRAGSAQIRNVDFQYNGKQVSISYDITNYSTSDVFYVAVEVFSKKKGKLKAMSFSGDMYGIQGGSGKKLFWELKKDGVFVDEEIYFRVKASVVPKVSLGTAMAKSLVLPGWGKYDYSEGAHWLWGVAAYGCVGSSFLMNRMAAANRENYMNATTKSEADGYYSQMKTQAYLSYALAGAAAVVWTVDIGGVIAKAGKRKKALRAKPNRKNSYPAIAGTSPTKYINTRAPIRPPMLAVSQESIRLIDENNNKAIDANEKCRLEFLVNNTGRGTGYGLTWQVSEKNGTIGLHFPKEGNVGDIEQGAQIRVTIPVEGSMSLQSGRAEFTIAVVEVNGFDTDPFKFSIPTRQFAQPNVLIVDYVFSTEAGGMAKRGTPINLKMVVQNTGQGTASEVKLKLSVPENVFITDLSQFSIGTLQAGETKEIDFEFFSNKRYQPKKINISASLSESYGKYAANKNMAIALNTKLKQTSKVVIEDNYRKKEFELASLRAETDKNIPVLKKKHSKRYALIIGNENYSSYQNGLSAESNVAFAENDAQIFAQYAEKVFGVEKKNIILINNATSAQIKRKIQLISTLAKKTGAQAELLVYYAGHGLPRESDKVPQLIPVDVSAGDLSQAISLHQLYRQLAATGASRITVFIDACFSGGARESGLLAARDVKIKARAGSLSGNMVVFTASSGKQSALAYQAKKHGMFTYFLLKKLQDTAGKLSYGELADYLKQQVSLEALRSNQKEQDPQVNISQQVKETWREWQVN